MELARRVRLIGTAVSLQNNQCRDLLLRSLVVSIHRSSCQSFVTLKVMRKKVSALPYRGLFERLSGKGVGGGRRERRKGVCGWGEMA